MDLKELKKQLKANPENKVEFEKYDLVLEISQMLIEARIMKGLTQEKLAELVHTKQSGIARAERGQFLPKLSFLEKIARAFNTYLIVKFGFMEVENQVNTNNSKDSYGQLTNLENVFQSPSAIPNYAMTLNSAVTNSYQLN